MLNGNGVDGSASKAGYLLGQRGYQILTPPNGIPANAPRFDYFRTKVYFDPSARRAREAAAQGREPVRVGRGRDAASARSRSSRTARCSRSSSARRSTAASPPLRSTRRPSRERPNVVLGREASRDLLRERRRQVPFPLMVPTVIERTSWIDRERPARLYRIERQAQGGAARLPHGLERVLGRPDDRLGRRAGARRQEPHAPHRRPHGTTSTTTARSCTWSCCERRRRRYWVVNTLLDRLSNETMIAIAKGLRPLAKVQVAGA